MYILFRERKLKLNDEEKSIVKKERNEIRDIFILKSVYEMTSKQPLPPKPKIPKTILLAISLPLNPQRNPINNQSLRAFSLFLFICAFPSVLVPRP